MVPSNHRVMLLVLVCLAGVLSAQPGFAQATDQTTTVFARDNLFAWCFVPFDDRHRTPQQRCDMLRGLGLLHHGHVDRFAALLETMKPHLYAINLNGTDRHGDRAADGEVIRGYETDSKCRTIVLNRSSSRTGLI